MEVLFYHLQRDPVEAVLPKLLERTLERGWRAVVRAGSTERMEALDAHLWTWDDAAFLPHGTARMGHAERQPVWLTTDADNPSAADVLFVVDGAAMDGYETYVRAVLMFDGGDEAAVQTARGHWRSIKADGHDLSYWQQAGGRWEKKA